MSRIQKGIWTKIYKTSKEGGVRMNIKQPTANFIRVHCPGCKNEQTVFGKSSSKVRCLVCDKELVTPTGGRARVKARVLKVL